ncbi:hypothetical protein BT63DRAFT_443628 [Microthyrium microscopicum]|uniref:SURF6-domain-containing protein n=1 Tax=Microthyrium microscopicum TaxID=703497 RepID=A0A6A6TWS8_9PEZI|nr:hypothetical protein BT63DRAFT_443628 [Microthyrium microscopicum]
MSDDLEERLKSHGRSFEGLMSLIPAKLYYEADNTDQWQRKKQTKEERKAARKAKLDPRNIVSAKDVMDENERKRKRELEGEDPNADSDDISDLTGKEAPREGLKRANKHKKQKVDKVANPEDDSIKAQAIAEKRREKRQQAKEKRQKEKEKEKQKDKKRLKQKREAKSAGNGEAKTAAQDEGENEEDSSEDDYEEETPDKSNGARIGNTITQSSHKQNTLQTSTLASSADLHEQSNDDADSDAEDQVPESSESKPSAYIPRTTQEQDIEEEASDSDNDTPATSGMDKIEVLDLLNHQTQSSPSNSPAHDSTFSHPSEVAVSSTTSLDPPTKDPKASDSEPKESKEVLRARLQAKIDLLRAARKADGADGKSARTRQELIDMRRNKQEARKARKKELRRLARENGEEPTPEDDADDVIAKARAEIELARLRGSGSPGSGIFTPPLSTDGMPAPNFAFGRIDFGDGEQYDARGRLISVQKKKGAPDAKTALSAAERRAARLAGMDEQKRADIESKELWLNAKKKAHGERVRDDVNLLKKTLKRKEKQKDRSEREWDTRNEGIRKSQEMRQKKREDNLQKRRDEKGGGKKPKAKFGTPLTDKQKRKKEKKRAFG